jgi:hypothetical protein
MAAENNAGFRVVGIGAHLELQPLIDLCLSRFIQSVISFVEILDAQQIPQGDRLPMQPVR